MYIAYIVYLKPLLDYLLPDNTKKCMMKRVVLFSLLLLLISVNAKPDGHLQDEPDAEAAEPEEAESERAEPEGAEPEGAEPEEAEPEGAEPEGAEPEGAEPEGAEPESESDPGQLISFSQQSIKTPAKDSVN